MNATNLERRVSKTSMLQMGDVSQDEEHEKGDIFRPGPSISHPHPDSMQKGGAFEGKKKEMQAYPFPNYTSIYPIYDEFTADRYQEYMEQFISEPQLGDADQSGYPRDMGDLNTMGYPRGPSKLFRPAGVFLITTGIISFLVAALFINHAFSDQNTGSALSFALGIFMLLCSPVITYGGFCCLKRSSYYWSIWGLLFSFMFAIVAFGASMFHIGSPWGALFIVPIQVDLLLLMMFRIKRSEFLMDLEYLPMMRPNVEGTI